ncbi:hypothetical protein XELAEV_18000571mg [Xenopus laevis]|nr:hypothetical protein XELAEV_18000571mg [Xenopus laevis]
MYTQAISLWLRFINDIILIWSGTQSDFFDFVNKLNINYINLKVTAEIQNDSINFLYIRIYRNHNQNLHTTVYRKETTTNSLLHADSQHPASTIRGIPTGQYLRIRRLCSTTNDFKIEAKKLYDRFKLRGCSHNCLKRAYQKALVANRTTLLAPRKWEKQCKQETTNEIRIIGDYSKEHKQIMNILTKHWHILGQDRTLKETIGDCPIITFRRSKNLRDRLMWSHFTIPIKSTWLSERTKGCYKCGKCLSCPFIEKNHLR